MIYRIVGAALLVGTFASSVIAQEVEKLKEASVDTWVGILAALGMALLIALGSFLTPKRQRQD